MSDENDTAVLQKEVKVMCDKIGRDHEQFKAAHEKALGEVKRLGAETGETKEQMARINKALDELVKEKDQLILRIKALGAQNNAEADPAVGEMRKMYGEFLRKGLHGASDGFSPDVTRLTNVQKAMSVISDPDGGYMVTPDQSGRLVKRIFETSDIRRVAAVQVIGSDALEGVYDLGEGSYGWVSETASRPTTGTPQIGKWRIPVHEMYANLPISQKLLDDGNFNPEQWLAEKTADKFARVENDAFVNGNGVGRPRGFLTYPAGTSLPGQIEQVASGVSGGLTGDKLMELMQTLKTAYRANAQFGMHRLTLLSIRQLKDSQNRYLWDPGLNGQTQQSVLGFSINEFNDMPTPAANSLSIILADWKEFYQVVDRVGIRVLRDPYTSKPNVLFYSTKRTGGDVINFEAAKILKFG